MLGLGLFAAFACFWLAGTFKQIEDRTAPAESRDPPAKQKRRRHPSEPTRYHDDGTICRA